MNSKKIFTSLCLAALLAACSNEEPLIEQSPPVSGLGEPDVVLNVSETVDNFDELVAGLRTAKVIRIVTPDFTRVVGSEGVSEFLTSSDSEFLELSNDSLRMSLTNEYLTLSSDLITEKNAKAPSTQYYLVHKSKEYIDEYQKILKAQQTQIAATRSGTDEVPEIEKYSGNAISVVNGQFVKEAEAVEPATSVSPVLEWNETMEVATRSMNSYRPKDVLRIWLLRHNGFKAMQHEIDWQINDVKLMIRDLNRYVKVEIHTRNTDFRARNDAYVTFYAFQDYVQENADKGWQWSPRVRKDIFILVSYGGYNGAVGGLGNLNVYNIAREYNMYAYGLAGTNPITCSKVVAHELGHILGAEHNNYCWWDGWWIFKFRYYDVMSYKLGRAPFIRDPKNRRIVQDNLRTY